MERYSYSFLFVPHAGENGGFMFYFTRNRWIDDSCVDSVTLVQKHVHNIPEVTRASEVLANGINMADLAYQLIAQVYAESKRPTNREVNVRPVNPSVPS